MITLAALLVFAAAWRVRSRATPRTYLTLVGVFCLALPFVLWLAAEALGDRVGRAVLGSATTPGTSRAGVAAGRLLAGDRRRRR